MTDKFGVIFDFNGTLFLDSEKHAAVFKEICKDYGLDEFSDEYIAKNIFGKDNRAILLGNYNPDASEEEIADFDKVKEEKYRELCIKDKDCLHLAKGAPEFIDFLKNNGIPYSIATSSPRVNVDFYFEYLGIGKWFTYDNIVYDDGSFSPKPAPDIYAKAAKKMGLPPENCIVFEDSLAGIRSANSANIGTVFAILPDGNADHLLGKVTIGGIIRDYTGYKELIEKHLSK